MLLDDVKIVRRHAKHISKKVCYPLSILNKCKETDDLIFIKNQNLTSYNQQIMAEKISKYLKTGNYKQIR